MEIKITNQKVIVIEPVNARMLVLKYTNMNPTELREYETFDGTSITTNKIAGLNFYNKEKFLLGDSLKINGINYTINCIEPGENFDYYLIDTSFNKSVSYLLPLVAESSRRASNYLVSTCLYNTYLNLEDYPQYSNNNFLFLCYKFVNDGAYKKLEKEIMGQKNFVTTIEPTSDFTIFVMEFAIKYSETISLFLEGSYHCFDPIIKEQIIDFYNTNNSNYGRMYSWIKAVLNRDKKEVDKLELKLGVKIPKNMSIESIPIIEEETYKL